MGEQSAGSAGGLSRRAASSTLEERQAHVCVCETEREKGRDRSTFGERRKERKHIRGEGGQERPRVRRKSYQVSRRAPKWSSPDFLGSGGNSLAQQ